MPSSKKQRPRRVSRRQPGQRKRVGRLAAIENADAVVGKRLERLVVAHHRRRLTRIGRLDALDAPADGWAAGDPPSRGESAVEVLIDGFAALPAVADAIERAQSSLWIAGWYITPHFRLRPRERGR